MNREIKFRAWHYADQKMYEVSVLDKFNDEEYNRVYLKGKEIKFGDRTNYFADDKMVSLMQFTGLHDKNGKEIYEGDIINTVTGKPMVIGWSKRFASFTIERDGWAFKHFFGEAMESNDIEVIGNIFENPNLLNP